MKLNKYQKAWIGRLKSGKTRKCKRKMCSSYPRGNCCLGVAVNVCKLERMLPEGKRDDEDLTAFPKTLQALKLNSDFGSFDFNKITPKWQKKLRLTDGFDGNWTHLVNLNDNTNMTHAEIGQFIDENREAIFKS